jgi:hypothetical protein
MQNQTRLFGEGYKFVYRNTELGYNIDDEYLEDEDFNWRRFPNDIRCEVKFFNK